MDRTKTRTLLSTVVLAVAVLAATVLAGPRHAAAQEYVPADYGPWPAVAVAALPSLFVVGMTVADTVSFAEGKRFDDVLAVGDLVTGGIVTLGAGIFLAVAIANASQPSQDPMFGVVGGIGLALGGYELAHGIWSLAHDRGPSSGAPSLGFAPTRGGGMFAVGGSF